MEKRRLGRTGHMSTVVTFGAIAIGKKEDNQGAADRAVELVLRHGVNHIDIAPGYGVAMERLAPWMPEIRQRVFLGAKTGKRTRDEAWENIDECMERLGVDGFDLFQHHSIGTMEELDKITAPGGALEALVELREQGGTRWLGITGHGPDAPAVHLEALRRFDFDTVMFPVSAAIFRNAEYRRNAEALFAEARAKGRGRSGDQDAGARRMGRPRARASSMVRPASRPGRDRQRALVAGVAAYSHRAEHRLPQAAAQDTGRGGAVPALSRVRAAGSSQFTESAVPGTRPRHPASDMRGGGKTYLALDLGAESGRAIAGTFDGERLALREVHRFPNVPVRRGENVHWDLPALFDEVKRGIPAAATLFKDELVSVGVDTLGRRLRTAR